MSLNSHSTCIRDPQIDRPSKCVPKSNSVCTALLLSPPAERGEAESITLIGTGAWGPWSLRPEVPHVRHDFPL